MAKKRKTTSAQSRTQWTEVIARWWGSELCGKLRRGFLGLLAAVIGVGGVGWGLRNLEGYVRGIAQDRAVKLTVSMKQPPAWADPALVESICLSSGIRCDDTLLDEKLTEIWAGNLALNPWVKRVMRVQKGYSGQVEVECELRQPIASVEEAGDATYFIDAEGVVLPGATVHCHVVKIAGIRGEIPPPGQTITGADAAAGLEVLTKILQMDQQLPASDRLWKELAELSVNNYEGRVSQRDSHLMIYTQKATEIRWGAAIGRSVPYHEADVKYKLATLYRTYQKYGSLDRLLYVELRDWRKETTDPIRQNG
jgi:hypothetical protein